MVLNDILGGSAASVLTTTYGLSYSLLIFARPLAPNLSFCVAATFVSSAILGLVIALASSLRFAIAAPGTSTAAITGILASSVIKRMAITEFGDVPDDLSPL
jgi:SulP family sulfate permease